MAAEQIQAELLDEDIHALTETAGDLDAVEYRSELAFALRQRCGNQSVAQAMWASSPRLRELSSLVSDAQSDVALHTTHGLLTVLHRDASAMLLPVPTTRTEFRQSLRWLQRLRDRLELPDIRPEDVSEARRAVLEQVCWGVARSAAAAYPCAQVGVQHLAAVLVVLLCLRHGSSHGDSVAKCDALCCVMAASQHRATPADAMAHAAAAVLLSVHRAVTVRDIASLLTPPGCGVDSVMGAGAAFFLETGLELARMVPSSLTIGLLLHYFVDADSDRDTACSGMRARGSSTATFRSDTSCVSDRGGSAAPPLTASMSMMSSTQRAVARRIVASLLSGEHGAGVLSRAILQRRVAVPVGCGTCAHLAARSVACPADCIGNRAWSLLQHCSRPSRPNDDDDDDDDGEVGVVDGGDDDDPDDADADHGAGSDELVLPSLEQVPALATVLFQAAEKILTFPSSSTERGLWGVCTAVVAAAVASSDVGVRDLAAGVMLRHPRRCILVMGRCRRFLESPGVPSLAAPFLALPHARAACVLRAVALALLRRVADAAGASVGDLPVSDDVPPVLAALPASPPGISPQDLAAIIAALPTWHDATDPLISCLSKALYRVHGKPDGHGPGLAHRRAVRRTRPLTAPVASLHVRPRPPPAKPPRHGLAAASSQVILPRQLAINVSTGLFPPLPARCVTAASQPHPG